MSMPSNNPLNRPEHFNYLYDKHVQHLNLKGLRAKTIDAYSRAIRRIGDHFDYAIDDLTEDQLLNYFSDVLKSHSISTVKLDLYGLKFFYLHTLKRSWKHIPLVKSPRIKRIPDVLSVLRRFWKVHQHPRLLFPNRKKTMEAVRLVHKPLDRGGIQKAMLEVVHACGFKKRFPFIPYAIATPRID